MKKIILILSLFFVCTILTGCNEKDLTIIDVTKLPVESSSGEIAVSGELVDSDEEEIDVSFEMVEKFMYEEDDEFAKTHGSGIEKYQVLGLKDAKKQKVINDKLADMYEETIIEYTKHVSEDYLPSLNGFVIFEDEKLVSFCISKKWLTNNETYVNEYFTVNKKTAEVMTLSDFYGNKTGFLNEISKKIYDEFEGRKEQFKIEYEVDDNYFFDLSEEDFYDKILLDQESFYVSEKKELVYYFQKYEIGPGVIGAQEFILIENIEI